jgi:2-keto-4-pentenoate hydratase/2-oxohepta-3-ene-1,7-dioic acid hydratase in catechol pathway
MPAGPQRAAFEEGRSLRFVSFEKKGKPAPGLLLDGEKKIVDLSHCVPEGGSLLDIIGNGPDGVARAIQAIDNAGERDHVSLSKTKLLAPIAAPRRNIICVGKNYYEHAKEFHDSGFDASAGKDAIPEFPIIFTKASTTVVGPGDPVPASADPTNSVDYEAELAVVIGKGGKNIAKNKAYDHVFGYMIVNDVTSRNLQAQHKQWFLGKNLDGFCPMGPYLVTADEVGDVTKLQVTAKINGELRQNAVVKDLIFDIPTLIECISGVMTLLPGDIIATGTPAGVGIGFTPPKFLKAGDKMEIEITGLGVLENTCV